MVRDNDVVAIFHSIHRVMRAEKSLKQQGLDILLIPVPRQLSSDCGLAIRFSAEARSLVLDVLAAEGLSPAELYCREGKGFRKIEDC